MSEISDLNDRLAELTGEMKAVSAVLNDKDGARAGAAKAGAEDLAAKLSDLDKKIGELNAAEADAKAKAEFDEKVAEAVKAQLRGTRAASMAGAIGQGGTTPESRRIGAPSKASDILKAQFRDYEAGELLTGILDVKGIAMGGLDVERLQAGKAKLEELGVWFAGVPEASKATLGTTDAAGGYTLANNLVDTVVKPATQEAVYQDLVTVINGVRVRAVDQPFRPGAPARMVVAPWGETKENTDLTYGTYTATMYTIARIYDIAKQYARYSAGAAEAEVMDELARAAVLGENYYISVGDGTDEPLGILTALEAAAGNAYETAFNSPSNSTVAGSGAAGIASMLGALAARSRRATAVVTDAVSYWTLVAQGSDSAGFFIAPSIGPTGVNVGGVLNFWGVPIYYDANLTAKTAIAGDFKATKLYRGEEFRVDTSDQAGDRWDKNLIGFRGEEEIGFNASSAVASGAFQFTDSLIP